MNHKTIVWVHGDNLNPMNPAFVAAPDAPAIFVWDDTLLQEWRVSLKRIVFIYECLLELPVIIRRGDVAAEVTDFALEHGATRILTANSPSPRHRLICQNIALRMPSGSRIEVLQGKPFVDYQGPLDLKRFYRYWKSIRNQALGE